MLSHWECYALAVAGVLGFVLQQVSLGTGRLAPSVATVSVANPVVGILIGIAPPGRAAQPARPGTSSLAVIGLGLALVGAVVISLAREATKGADPAAAVLDESVATAQCGCETLVPHPHGPMS